MKNAKSIVLMLICGLTTFTVSSCLDDGGNNNGGGVIPTMTLADSIEACQKSQGMYAGKLYYINPNKNLSTDKEDSVDVRWTISNSTMTRNRLVMDNFPIKPLALYVNDRTSLDHSKEILEAAETQTLTTNVIPYLKLSTQYSTLFQYSIMPIEEKMEFNVVYENNTHHVVVVFTEKIEDSNGYYYYPISVYHNNLFQGNILIEKVYVDGYEYKIATVFGIKAKKG